MNCQNNKTHIIAEAGTNHGGNIDIAKKLVQIAYQAQADSVKFQIIYPEGLYLPKFYKNGKYEENEVFNIRKDAMLSDEEYGEVAKYCGEVGIKFSASIFDIKGIALLDSLDAPYIKIASCDLNNSLLLKKAAEKGRTLLVSTGMSTLGEIEQAITDIVSTGNNDIILMHCVSIYPCSIEKMNLQFIEILKTSFGFPVGLSDHTESNIAGVIAVSMGVKWIEKHFTYNRNAQGFDHAYAMEPQALKDYVASIRAAEKACTRSAAKILDEEISVKNRARRALYAARDIFKGEIINLEDIIVVRPEGPLSPNEISCILQKSTNCDIKKYEPLRWEQFQF
jgi:sialic acid synthase SpsE